MSRPSNRLNRKQNILYTDKRVITHVQKSKCGIYTILSVFVYKNTSNGLCFYSPINSNMTYLWGASRICKIKRYGNGNHKNKSIF